MGIKPTTNQQMIKIKMNKYQKQLQFLKFPLVAIIVRQSPQ